MSLQLMYEMNSFLLSVNENVTGILMKQIDTVVGVTGAVSIMKMDGTMRVRTTRMLNAAKVEYRIEMESGQRD